MHKLLGSVILLITLGTGNASDYKATIDIAGFKGQVTFVAAGSNLTIEVMLTKPSGVTANLTTIEVMEHPAVFGQTKSAQQVCSNLGHVLFTVSGMNAGSTVTVENLAGNDVFQRGIRINGFAQPLCATVLPTSGEVVTSRAKFMGPIAGEVWMRRRTSTSGLFFYSNLAYANNQPNPTGSSTVQVVVYSSGSVGTGSFSARCDSLGASTDLVASLIVGNSAASSGKRQSNFIASSSSSFTIVALKKDGAMISCAEVRTIQRRTAQTTFSWDNAMGTIVMTQSSPFDVTNTNISLSGLQHLPVAYHVHKFPVPQRVDANDGRCSAANVAGHFNPFGVNVTASPTSGTSDQYEIGDLSGKYGKISTASLDQTNMDWNLPLFGANSVIGRSIVIHRNDNSRWICATIDYPGTFETAVLNFRHPAFGIMYLRQATDVDADTIIWGKLQNMDGVASSAHNFHVHVDSVGADCASAGPHYNPSQVFVGDGYKTHCSAADPFVCELGDLSLKHDAINIDNKPFFFTDPYLPLYGPFNVIDRSIVVHVASKGAGRYACANITKMRGVLLESDAGAWKGEDKDGSVDGVITIMQKSEFDPSVVTGSLTGLASSASTYKIHDKPVDAARTGIQRCQVTSLGNMFDPYNVGTAGAASQTSNKYAVGDLGAKYGSLASESSVTLQQSDSNLPLVHEVGIAGRSVVIYKSTNGTPEWKCTNLNLRPNDATGHVIRARAIFTEVITGYVDFTQVVYDDGSASPTLIDMNLVHNGVLSATNNHNWHVHIDPIMKEGSCSVARGHYNPYGANVSSPTYSTTCNRASQLGCEVGDLSNKHEKYNIGGSSLKHYIDDDLPLHTDKTILGRSIVFHVKDAGSPRYTCANIQSYATENTYTLAFPSSVAYDHFRFTDAVAKMLGIPRMRVVAMHNTKVPVSGEGCSKVMVYIAGTLTSAQKSGLLAGSSSHLDPYKPTEGICKNEEGLTVTGLTELKGASPSLKATMFVSVFCALISLLLQSH